MLCNMEWEPKPHQTNIKTKTFFDNYTVQTSVPTLCHCINTPIPPCIFFHPNPTTEQRTAQKFPFGLRCATGLTVSCIITLLCLAWWRSAWAGLHTTLRFTISLLCHANDKSGHACCHNILRHYEILATKIKAILSLLLFVHLFLSNAEIICHHLVTK